MCNVKYSVPPCEREWESRSLAELVAYVTHRYRQPTRQRIDAVASALPRVVSSTPQPREAYDRVETVFTSLREAIETHVWLVDGILCPAIVASEHDPASTNQSVREALCRKIGDVDAARDALRRLSVTLRQAVIEIKGASVSMDEAVLAVNLDMLVLLLNERLDLEDRCLWPRALVLLHTAR